MDQNGDARGAELEQFRPYLHLIARMHLDYRLRARIDPEDVVQDAFRKALEKWGQCRESRKAWLRELFHPIWHKTASIGSNLLPHFKG